MGSTNTFNYREADVGGNHPGKGQITLNLAKVLPATATGNLFTVSGSILCSLSGVVTTVFSATSTHISIGVTGNTTALAAPPGSGIASIAVGSTLILPTPLGAPLPAPLVASGTAVGATCVLLELANTIVTVTTDATNSGAVTWTMDWYPLTVGASVTAD